MKACDDKNCPFHGTLRIRRGKLLKGKVVSAKAPKTAVVRVDYLRYVPKYERYERRHSKIHAHNPPCIGAKEGDEVVLAPTRRISKTKAHVIIEVVRRASE